MEPSELAAIADAQTIARRRADEESGSKIRRPVTEQTAARWAEELRREQLKERGEAQARAEANA